MLEEPECSGGYTKKQIERILGDDIKNFYYWMRGQTQMLCEGRRWDHKTRGYIEDCGGIAHGPVVYPWDLKRYLEMGRGEAPILD